MARSILEILRAHPELDNGANVIPALHLLASEHRIGSWKISSRGFLKHFGPKQEAELLALYAQGFGSGYDPYRTPGGIERPGVD